MELNNLVPSNFEVKNEQRYVSASTDITSARKEFLWSANSVIESRTTLVVGGLCHFLQHGSEADIAAVSLQLIYMHKTSTFVS